MEQKMIELSIKMAYGSSETEIHPVLLCDEKNIILVDCGFIGSLPLIEAEIIKHNIRPKALTGIVITHHDHDHMGAVAAFKAKYTNVKIYASEQEAPYISATIKPLRLAQAEEMQKTLPPDRQAFGEAFCDLLRRIEPVGVDVLLKDGDIMNWCGGCEIIATPGHTPGHISLFLPRHNTVIAGDAIALENGKPVLANPQFTLDIDKAKVSMQKLLVLNADTMFCYHK